MIREPLCSGARWLPAATLSLLVLLLPLPFGGIVPWAAAGAEVLAFASLALALAAARSAGEWRPIAWPAAALTLLALIGCLQILPLPGAVLARLAPRTQLQVEQAVRALPLDAEPPRAALSWSPGVTARVSWSFAALAAALAAAAVAGRRRRPRRLLAAAVLLAVVVQVVLGLRGWFAGSKAIWGIAVEGDASRLRGTFVNPNHFALLLEIGLAVAFALAWWSLRRARFEARLEAKVLLAGPPLLLWLGLFACLAFSGSRAGLLAAMAGTALQAAVLGLARRSGRPLLLGLGAIAAGLAVVVTTGMRQGLGRWFSTSAAGGGLDRLAVYRAALELWSRAPWLGTGLGTFRESFPLVQSAATRDVWWHAHSDVLELLQTAGVAGLAVAAVGLSALAARLFAVARRGLRSEDRAAALAALGALGAAGLHEGLDFGLTMPGNAYLLAVVVGAAAGAALEPAPAEGGLAEETRSG